MDEQPDRGAQDAPPVLNNLKGWVVGLTGLVVAMAGLLGAYRQIVPASSAEPAAAAAAPSETGKPLAAADAAAAADEDLPLLYEGENAKLEFVDDKWVLTTSEGTYDYEDMYSKYEGSVLAFDKLNNAYLRWPIKGGMGEDSTDEKQSWNSYVELYPVAQPEEANAAE